MMRSIQWQELYHKPLDGICAKSGTTPVVPNIEKTMRRLEEIDRKKKGTITIRHRNTIQHIEL